MFRLSRIFKDFNESGALNAHVSLYGFWDEQMVITKAGDLILAVKVQGVDYECLDSAARDYVTKRLESAFRTFDGKCRLYQILFKENRPEIPWPEHDNPVVNTTLQNRRRHFETKADSLYEIDIYFVFLYEGFRYRTGLLHALPKLAQSPANAMREIAALYSNRGQTTLIREQVEAAAEVLRNQVRLFLQSTSDYLGAELLPAKGVFRLFHRLLNVDREKRDNAALKDTRFLVGTVQELPTLSAAQAALDALRLDINQQTPQQLIKDISLETLVNHYRQHEMPDIFLKRKPAPDAGEDSKSYATQKTYEGYLRKWILPRWRSYRLTEIKAVEVERWLKPLVLARGTKAKIRNIMSALYSHAIRWEWADKNPISSVRQSAKRECTPDILTPEEIMAILKELSDPLRMMVELEAFTGLRRGEMIGLKWEDVNFDTLVLHVRRSVVAMVEGAPKTEASRKEVPVDAQLAESLWTWKQKAAYPMPSDWVFASPHMKGRQPYWPTSQWRHFGRPALKRAGVTKDVTFHTFRHTFGTLLNANGENAKVVQELLRHASLKVTTDVYMQAVSHQKREAQGRFASLVRGTTPAR